MLPRYTHLLTAIKALLADDHDGYLLIMGYIRSGFREDRSAESKLRAWKNINQAVTYKPASTARALFKEVLTMYTTYTEFIEDWKEAQNHLAQVRKQQANLRSKKNKPRG